MDGSAAPAFSLSASISLSFAGSWTLAVTEGTKNEQHLRGSPYTILVKPAMTDPAECTSAFTKILTAGANFVAVVSTYDKFKNPTDADEAFYAYFSSSPEAIEFLDKDDSSKNAFVFNKTVTSAGLMKLHVGQTASDLEIANSPFNFQVSPGGPSASTSTHNMVKKDFASRNVHTVDLELRIQPYDAFGNLLTGAEGFSVSINDGPKMALPAPHYSHVHVIMPNYSGDLKVSNWGEAIAATCALSACEQSERVGLLEPLESQSAHGGRANSAFGAACFSNCT